MAAKMFQMVISHLWFTQFCVYTIVLGVKEPKKKTTTKQNKQTKIAKLSVKLQIQDGSQNASNGYNSFIFYLRVVVWVYNALEV